MPDIPGIFAQNFSAAHHYGLLAMDAACADAGLDYRAGDLTAAAILTGRGAIDTMVAPYAAVQDADFRTLTPNDGSTASCAASWPARRRT
jgi:3-oxoacyl-[acyl-carrier-protein] synthase II